METDSELHSLSTQLTRFPLAGCYHANLMLQIPHCLCGAPLGNFVTILTHLVSLVLGAGFILYCMAVRRGERAEFLALFDGFALVGRLIGLALLEAVFILLWSMLFILPGIIAAYRYRFAYYNILTDGSLSAGDAIRLSCQQTYGMKMELFVLDLSFIGWAMLAALTAAAP